MATSLPAPGLAAEHSRPLARVGGDSGPVRGGRLAAVDGLRAVAALWVVLFHMRAFSGVHLGAHLTLLKPLDFVIRSGSTGVSLFLVLSGFCLFLPFAGGRTARFRVGGFFIRRARRLLPAYYCSLGLALLINLAGAGRLGFPHLSPAEATRQVVTHLALIHTLFPDTFYALNGAYWSLGLEWQLYLALPILIIGAARFGLARTAIAAVLVNVIYRVGLALAASWHVIPPGTLLSVVLPNQLPGRWAEFVFGMVAADVYARGALDRCRPLVWYGGLPLLITAVALVGDPVSHILFGGVFFLLLVAALGQVKLVSTILSWPPLVALGVMSYSIYLVHQPLILAASYLLRNTLHASPLVTFAALIVALPLILIVAWVLFVVVERRTVTSHPTGIPRVATLLLFPNWRFGRPATAVEAQLPSPGGH